MIMADKTNVYIVHGYTASPEQNWFPWLKKQLGKKGIPVTVFDMPDSLHPEAEKWDRYLDTHINECNEDTILIGHSLGCIASLRYLDRQAQPLKVKGIVMVSGFLESVPALPELDSFCRQNIDAEKIISMAGERIAFTSDDDSIVPPEYTRKLAVNLKAALITVNGAGHFLDREGYTEFSELLREICRIIERRFSA